MSNETPRESTADWLDRAIAEFGTLSAGEVHKLVDVECKRATQFIDRQHETPTDKLTDLIECFLDARDEEAGIGADFAREVLAMLDLQQAYFKSRKSDALVASKLAERKVRERARKLANRQVLGPTAEITV